MEEVLNFIQRRFKKDCDWTNGNCYYFAIILKDRFPQGNIYYNVIECHFVFKYQDNYFDWNGLYSANKNILIQWDNFEEFDSLQKERIIRDCVM